MMAASPSLPVIFVEHFMDNIAYFCYSLAESTAVADLVKDPGKLAVDTQRASQTTKGAAQILANLAGGFLAAKSPRMPFVIGAACCLCAGGVVAYGVKETNGAQREGGVDHEPSKGTRGPLALFRKGRLLRVLTLSAVVDGMADKTHQLRAVHAQQRLGIGPSLYGVWSAGRGAMSMLSGTATAVLLRLTGGVRGFSLFTHAAGVVSPMLLALMTRPAHLFLALVPMCFSEQGVRQSCTMALHARASAAAGLGLGEAQAALRMMQSVLQLGVPLGYGYLCEWRLGAFRVCIPPTHANDACRFCAPEPALDGVGGAQCLQPGDLRDAVRERPRRG